MVDVFCVLLDLFWGRFSFVDAVAGVFHGQHVDLVEIPEEVEEGVWEFDVLSWGVEVEEEVFAVYHGIQV